MGSSDAMEFFKSMPANGYPDTKLGNGGTANMFIFGRNDVCYHISHFLHDGGLHNCLIMKPEYTSLGNGKTTNYILIKVRMMFVTILPI